MIGRPKTALLSKDKIVAGALDMIDDIGVDKFSIYKLAKVLGVSSPSVYYYFKDREQLLVEVGFLVLADVKGPKRAEGVAWTDWLELVALAYYTGLRRHPNAMSLLLDRNTHPVSTKLFESALEQMAEVRIPPEHGLILVDALSALALSWVGFGVTGDSQRRFDGLDTTLYPALDIARSVRMGEEERFRFAARAMIASFGHLGEWNPPAG